MTKVPTLFYRKRLERVLESARQRDDWDEILERVNYYNKLSVPCTLPTDSTLLSDYSYKTSRRYPSVYFFDSYEYLRWFPETFRFRIQGGDTTNLFSSPTLTKSRPIGENNACSVLLKLNRIRHYLYIDDPHSFADKECRIAFAGVATNNPKRLALFEKFFGHPLFDLYDISPRVTNPAWQRGKISIADQLRYRYIMAVEGNDVATSLKWIMSSNSVAVMPRPVYETWFMEGCLVPGYHYVEVRDDYSDLLEKIDYYEHHPAEAEAIVQHAHEWWQQFRDRRRESLISLLVLDKYFRLTGQKT